MVDLDDDIHAGIQLLVTDAPEPVEWDVVTRRQRLRRRRRTTLIGATAIGVVLLLIAGVAHVSRDDTTVVAGPVGGDLSIPPCGAWIAVHTLFDSSANARSDPGSTVGAVTAEQAAFLVKSGDVPDRVAQELDGDASDLTARVVARPNTDLGTIEITAWGEDPAEAQRLSDAFAEALLASVQDIQQREIDRQRDVLNAAITQLELELAGVVGDDRTAVTSRERLSAEIADKEVQLQQLTLLVAHGTNIYSFGNAQAFQVTGSQIDTLFGNTGLQDKPEC
jgi:hypothetical protein